MTCFLCMEESQEIDGSIHFNSKEAEMLGIPNIIEQHFWLRTTNASELDRCICKLCWDQLLTFHKFYLNIEQVHKAFEQIVLTTEPEARVGLEPEIEISQVDAKVEIPPIEVPVKRKRGRPRRNPVEPQSTNDATSDNSELKAVLEQITLNEIKIEFPEADLTIGDVLEEQDNEQEDTSDYMEEDTACDSEDIEEKPKRRRTQTTKNFAIKRKTSSVPNMKKSQEFNEYIKQHFKVHCPFCNEPMEDFAQMLVHSRSVHKTRGYATCCSRKFWKRGVLVDHLRRHQDPELFKCHLCDRVMGQRRSLELHLRMHDIKQRGRLHKCEQCSKSFYSQIVYERHKLTHIPKELYQVPCTTCDKTFPTKYIMQQHVKLVHLNMYAKICDVCGKSIRGREALARHMEEHAGAPHKAIECHLCGSVLTTKYGLARHIKMMHTAENLQPIQCEICFKMSPSLQAHQHHIKYTHNTARNHQCRMCEKAFKRPNELREHMTTHTGEVLYTCPHCPKTFNSNANMHAHRKKVHRKEWEEQRQQRSHLTKHKRRTDSIIATSVRKTSTKTVANMPIGDDMETAGSSSTTITPTTPTTNVLIC